LKKLAPNLLVFKANRVVEDAVSLTEVTVPVVEVVLPPPAATFTSRQFLLATAVPVIEAGKFLAIISGIMLRVNF
jgi:hypothetical protein